MTQLAVDPSSGSTTPNASAASGGRAPRPPNLGLGLHPGTSTMLSTPHKELITSSPYPHLAHYVATLLASVHQPSPPRQHPLSVSSSGESDEDTPPGGRSRDEGAENGSGNGKGNGDDAASATGNADAKSDSGASAVTSVSTAASSSGGDRKVSGAEKHKEVDKAALVRQIVELLDNEEEEKVKDVLKPFLGDLANDEILMEQVCLDCMHKRKDDQEQLPFTPMQITPSRPRLTPHVTAPLRPYSPSRVPSFRAATPLGRPQSPLLSGAVTPTGLPGVAQPSLVRHESASKLPSLGLGNLGVAALSAKASAFNPAARIASPSASASAPITAVNHPHTWIPADAWKDAPEPLSRTASPFGGAAMARTSSNLAIAAPLFSDQSSPFHSPIGTPLKGTVKMPDVFSSPSTQPTLARTASIKALIPDDDDDDEFSPFGTGLPKLHHLQHQHSAAPALQLNSGAQPFEPFGPTSGVAKSASSLSQSSASADHDYEDGLSESEGDGGAGMTPLDVLHQVFTTLPRSELEAALHASGYDFEGAMALLMSQHANAPRSGTSTPGRTASPRPLLNIGGRALVQANHHAPSTGYFNQGGRNFGPGPGQGQGGMYQQQHQQQPFAGAGHGHGARTPGGLKMCRYYLNGECRRSDCRFSHDLDRALCRFWLRGNCAKGPNCEFLHQLPPNLTQQASAFDPGALSSAMSRLELSSDGSYRRSPAGTPTDEFPDLMGARFRPGNRFDPSRNRFANALKRPQMQFNPAMPVERGQIHVTGGRMNHNHNHGGNGAAFAPPDARQAHLHPTAASSASQTVPTPKQSQRIRLRSPTLLPTISTGSSANEQYLTSRQNAIRLGHARNACLARAADAFRRGDGAAAKRFSREGKSLNERMLHESAEAAAVLVKERMADAQKAIRERDPSWSDDPADRSQRGKEAGGGYGVVMGVAGRQKLKAQNQGAGYEQMSEEERAEVLCDLHTLHGVEAVEVLGVFLAELEKERYRGLTYLLVGEEKHVGMQDPLRGTSKIRLAHSVKVYLTEEGYAWMEGQGWVCVDSCRS